MRRCLFVVCYALWCLCVCGFAHAVQPPEANSSNIMKSPGGFAGSLWLTEDKSIGEKWEKSGGKDKIKAVNVGEKGKSVYALIFITNQGVKSGKSNVSYEVVVKKPDGAIYKELKGTAEWKVPSSAKKDSIRLCNTTPLEIKIENDAPTGTYSVRASVRDAVGNVSLDLSQNFDVHPFGPLPDYDFTRDYTLDLKKEAEAAQAEENKKLAQLYVPVEGISLERYAAINARAASGEDKSAILKKEKIRPDAWEKAEKAWTARMASDKTMRLNAEYSKQFMRSGVGRYAEAGRAVAESMSSKNPLRGEPPIPFEKWVEISQALAVGSQYGRDFNKTMETYGLTIFDWSVIGNWWGLKFNQNTKQLYPSFIELSKKYKQQFEAQFGNS